jgi:GAF domain-containing protein
MTENATAQGAADADALTLLTARVAELVGTTYAALAVVDDDAHVEVIALVRDPDDPDAGVRPGAVLPVDDLLGGLSDAPGWEPFGRAVRPDDGSERLVAPLRDGDGALAGVLWVGLPAPTGSSASDPHDLRPVVEQATREVLARRWLADRLRLAEQVRQAVRAAVEHHSLPLLLEHVRPALLRHLHARGMWIQTFDDDGLGRGTVDSADGKIVDFTETVYAIAYNAAHALWDEQQTLVLDRAHVPPLLSAAESRDVAAFLDGLEVDSILFVPVGAGAQCLGNLVLSRGAGSPPWTADEATAALNVAHAIGVAIHAVRSHARERRLAQEVLDLESRVSKLVASGAHDGPGPDVGAEPGGRAIDRDLGVLDPDLVRTRAELRAASDAREQIGRRRDVQARLVADAVAQGVNAPAVAVQLYRDLKEQYREAHLYWQVAYDAWQEVSARLP